MGAASPESIRRGGDLFCEGFEASKSPDLRVLEEEELSGHRVVYGEAGAAHPRRGRYATVMCRRLWETPPTPELAACVSQVLERCLREASGGEVKRLLVCALGNENVAADSLGARSAEKVLSGELNGRFTAVIKTGTEAQVGLPAAQIIAAVCRQMKADAVICIDSLAALRDESLGSVIQISDGGIVPGSGVSSHREAVESGALGVPVIGVGIPVATVSDTGVLMTCAAAEELARRGGAVIAGAINRLMWRSAGETACR